MIPTLQLGGLGRSQSAASGPTDPSFASVTLLLHCEGADASTTFTDNSTNAFTMTAGGNAQVDTAQFKYGAAGALFDGTGDYITHATDNAFRYSADFTVEFWVRPNTTATALLYEGRASGGSATGFAIYKTPTTLAVYTNNADQIIYNGSIGTGAWHHIALSRTGTAIKLWLDGVQVGATYTSAANFSDGVLFLGADTAGTNSLDGHMDDIRITNGVGRYTANFTPPTAQFPDS